jgi:hypothetical protein
MTTPASPAKSYAELLAALRKRDRDIGIDLDRQIAAADALAIMAPADPESAQLLLVYRARLIEIRRLLSHAGTIPEATP